MSTDVEILSYRTWIDWDTENDPQITESGNPTNTITVDWDLSDKPVPQGEEVTITTEFVLPSWNAMTYSDVHFTYGSDGKPGPKFAKVSWNVRTPQLQNLERLPNNVTGGFVVGAFELVQPEQGRNSQELRFVHEYSFNQTPEQHVLVLNAQRGLVMQNLRVGHTWNYPSAEELQRFENWMTRFENKDELQDTAMRYEINWKGMIKYPEGENIYKAIPDVEGEQQYPGDLKN